MGKRILLNKARYHTRENQPHQWKMSGVLTWKTKKKRGQSALKKNFSNTEILHQVKIHISLKGLGKII